METIINVGGVQVKIQEGKENLLVFFYLDQKFEIDINDINLITYKIKFLSEKGIKLLKEKGYNAKSGVNHLVSIITSKDLKSFASTGILEGTSFYFDNEKDALMFLHDVEVIRSTLFMAITNDTIEAFMKKLKESKGSKEESDEFDY